MKKLTTKQAIKAMATYFDVPESELKGMDIEQAKHYLVTQCSIHLNTVNFWIRQQQLSGKI